VTKPTLKHAAVPLLTTKLTIPPTRPELVPRPRLIERLNAGIRGKLTLISAPAGFGKTTLLSEWVGLCGQPIAWVSLEQGDNDPVRFWAYCIAALQRTQARSSGTTKTAPSEAETVEAQTAVGAAALAMLRSARPPSTEAILTTLINDVAAITDDFGLVLDDYHAIDAQSIHAGLAFLLDHLPPQMHVVIASRSDPPLPLARLRTRGQLTELRAADLLFTPDEAATFLNDVMGLGLSAGDVAALETRTEGWIAGLQVAALSMQGRRDVSGFIAAFTGSHRYVLDYLAEEVLQQQPESVQAFLLQTAILDRLSGPLCEAVMGIDKSANLQICKSANQRADDLSICRLDNLSGQAMLEYLEDANLFVVPLDDERRWYRYHHLFADLLRSQLRRSQPDLIPTLHRRASAWYEQDGLIGAAVQHALAAGDVERAARLIEGNALAMMDHGELTTVVGWLDALPEAVVRSRPWLCISHAWALTYTGQLDGVEPRLQDAERALAGTGVAGETSARRIAGHVAAMRAYVAASEGEATQAIALGRQALEHLPERDTTARAFAAAVLGSGYRHSGDLAAAADAIAEVIATSRRAGDRHMAILAGCNLAATRMLQGQLHRAAATFREALEVADRLTGRGGHRLPFAGLPLTGLATVLRERNELEEAERLASEGVALSKQWGQAEVLMHGYAELAQVRHVRGDRDGAREAMEDAIRIARDLSTWTAASLRATQARLHLMQGPLASAARWAQESGLDANDVPGFQRAAEYLVLARVLIAQDRLDPALELLARLLQVVEAAGAMGYVIEALSLQALALHARGDAEQALEALARALSLAEPEDYVRTFVDAGEPMAELLCKAARRGVALDYAKRLLEASSADGSRFQVSGSGLGGVPAPARHETALVEPLSERELEVLRLVAAGLSNREIADELIVAVGTVKKHTHNVFGKLGVRSRTQAILRAKELNLI
jgi:LuxR family maltose regulon positive regulatory protein